MKTKTAFYLFLFVGFLVLLAAITYGYRPIDGGYPPERDDITPTRTYTPIIVTVLPTYGTSAPPSATPTTGFIVIYPTVGVSASSTPTPTAGFVVIYPTYGTSNPNTRTPTPVPAYP